MQQFEVKILNKRADLSAAIAGLRSAQVDFAPYSEWLNLKRSGGVHRVEYLASAQVNLQWETTVASNRYRNENLNGDITSPKVPQLVSVNVGRPPLGAQLLRIKQI